MNNTDNYTPSQRSAIFHENGNLLVSASAGSGKTFVMISRIIDLILSGKADVKEILAVTYTNLAAEEMKQKLVKELVKGISEGKNVDRLKKALSDVPDADFSTFHGFLGKLLRSYFYACDLDPLYAIADETEAKELKNLAIERLFDKKYKSADEDFLYLTRIYRKKRGDGDLKDMVLALSDFASSEAYPEEFFDKGEALSKSFESFYKKLAAIYAEKLTALIPLIEKTSGDCEFSGFEKHASYAKELVVSAQIALSSLRLERYKELPDSLPDLPKGKKSDEILSAISDDLKREKAEFLKIISAANEWLLFSEEREKEVLSTARAAKTLTSLAKEFDEEYSKIKRAENKADFSDLERLALKLLKSHEEIRAEISEKYKYVFADEYQDVNGVQEEILRLIAKDNLFMVGDVKQSIYAFRGCNPEIFAEKYDEYSLSHGGKALSLDENFRSADGVLSAVNNVFSHVITRSFGSVDYAENPMRGFGLYKDFKGTAILHILEGEKHKKEKSSGIYSVLKAFNEREAVEDFYEGALTAKIIESELGKPIFDVKTGEMRETTFGDIAVLTRNSKGFTTKVVKELSKYFIPVTSEAGENLCDYPEIKLLVDVMKLISFYADDAPLAATLKSAVGKLDEEELAEIRRPYSRRDKSFADCVRLYEKDGENAGLREKLKNFREYFEKIRLLSEFTGAGEILARVMKDTGLDLEINGMPLGEMRMERVEKFLLGSVNGGKALSVNEFLKRIEFSPSDLILSPKGGEDTVKVMSIHASKGLEFPVVIVAGLKRQFSAKSRTGEVLFDRGLGFALKSYDEEKKTCAETLIRQYFKEKIKLDTVKEEARIFYVAMTRAKCRLHLIADCNVQEEFSYFSLISAGKFADFISKRDMPCVYHDREDLIGESQKEQRKVLVGTGNSALEEKILENLSFSYPYAPDEKVPVKSAVTKIAEDYTGTAIPPLVPPEREFSYDKTTAEKGVAYHRFMETCFLTAKDAENEIKRLLSLSLLTKEQAEYLDEKALNKVLSLDVIKGLSSYEIYREQPFLAFFSPEETFLSGKDGKTLVQGVIDLLAVKGDEAIIIDYKTSSKSLAELKEKYAVQLNLYSSAVERALKLKVRAKILINLLSGEYAEV